MVWASGVRSSRGILGYKTQRVTRQREVLCLLACYMGTGVRPRFVVGPKRGGAGGRGGGYKAQGFLGVFFGVGAPSGVGLGGKTFVPTSQAETGQNHFLVVLGTFSVMVSGDEV